MIEARFTAPRADCPHPEWWHSVDDESTELEVSELVAAFMRGLQPELVVEVGTAFGQTARLIGEALQDNGHGRLLTYEVEGWRASLAGMKCIALPVRVINERFTPPDEPVGFAWIDGHIDERIADLRALRLNLLAGSFVGVHDTSPFHGIRELVEAEQWIRWVHLPTPRGVMFGEVL